MISRVSYPKVDRFPFPAGNKHRPKIPCLDEFLSLMRSIQVESKSTSFEKYCELERCIRKQMFG